MQHIVDASRDLLATDSHLLTAPQVIRPTEGDLVRARQSLSSPLEKIDNGSKGFTKFRLLTEEGCAADNEFLGAHITLAFIDISNMGPTNSVNKRLSGLIDQWIGCFRETAEQVFGKGNYRFYRLGGDEFAVALNRDGVTGEALKAFSELLIIKKNELFKTDDPDVQTAMGKAWVRNRVRETLHRFSEEKGEDATTAEFMTWIRDNHPSEYETVLQRIASNNLPKRTLQPGRMMVEIHNQQLLELRQSGATIDPKEVALMVPDIVFVDLDAEKGEQLSPELYAKFIGAGDLKIHQLKQMNKRGEVSELTIAELRDIHVRDAERSEIEEAGRTLLRWNAAMQSTEEVVSQEFIRGQIEACCSDPSVPSVLRHGSINDVPASVILAGFDPERTKIIHFDLEGFGLLNNSKKFGYARADQAFARMAEKAITAFASDTNCTVGIRTNGGELVIITDSQIDDQKIKDLANEINRSFRAYFQQVMERATDSLPRIEYSARRELKLRSETEDANTRPVLGAVTIAIGGLPKEAVGGTMGELMRAHQISHVEYRKSHTNSNDG